MKITPCAINSHWVPRFSPSLREVGIHIHSFAGTDTGCHPVPEPACGDGSCDAVISSISIFIPPICIPLMGLSCPDASCPHTAHEKLPAIRHTTTQPDTPLPTAPSPRQYKSRAHGTLSLKRIP